MTTERHTPPVTKWLANELAALNGELQQIAERLAHLTERRTQVISAIAALSKTARLFEADNFMRAVPAVRAHGRYGGRGNLIRFLEAVVREAAPEFIDTVSLTHLAVEAFGLPLVTNVEFGQFRDNSLRRALRVLEHRGLIECSHAPTSGALTPVSYWRWKNPVPGIEALREQMLHAVDLGRE